MRFCVYQVPVQNQVDQNIFFNHNLNIKTMFLIFLGIVALIVGFAINTPSLTIARFSRPAKVLGGVLIGA